MSIDIGALSQRSQRQLLTKVLEQEEEKARRAAPAERKTSIGKTIKFRNEKAAKRYDELIGLLRRGKIWGMDINKEIVVEGTYTKTNGTKVKAEKFTVDFLYTEPVGENGWHYVAEHVDKEIPREIKVRMKERYQTIEFSRGR